MVSSISTKVTSAPVLISGHCLVRAVRNRDATASNCRTWPNRKDRRNVPNVDGARTPRNNRPIPPCRSTAISEIESAPVTMPPTSADTFNPAAWPAPPGTVKCWSARSIRPARVANPIAGTRPACDTRFGSSNTAVRTGTA